MKWLKQVKRNEKGDIAIEALLGLIVFILGFMAVLMFSMLIRLEASTQYAVDQVAKEVSQYYYIVEKAGLLPDSSAPQPDTTVINNNMNNAKDAIGDMQKLAGSLNSGNYDNILGQIDAVGSNAEDAVNSAKKLKNGISGTDWNEQLGIILNLTVKSGTNRLVGCLIADPICSMLFPKYISASDLDAYLKANGIENGKDGLHFERSTFLADGYTINVVLNYKVNLKALTFGMYDGDIYVQQTACTAAWIHYKGSGTGDDKNLKNLFSLWDIAGQGERGKKIVSYMETKGGYGLSIKNGTGFDLYDESSNTLTKIKSIHFFDSKVTAKNEDGTYTLDKKVLKSRVSQYMGEMYNEVDKVNGKVTLEGSGEEKTLNDSTKYQMVIVVPENAKQFSGDIDAIVAELMEDKEFTGKGYKVKIVYDQCEMES